MNAKRLIVTLTFTAILMAFFIWMTSAFLNDAARKNRIWKEEAQKVTDAIDYIDSRNYDIMFYGESLPGPSTFVARHVFNLQEEFMYPPEEYASCAGKVLIINDPKGELAMTQDQLRIVFRMMTEDNYVVVYLGSALLEPMQKMGFFFKSYAPSTRSVILWNSGADYEFGFADQANIVPEVVRQGLTDEQKSIYTMIMKIASEKYF